MVSYDGLDRTGLLRRFAKGLLIRANQVGVDETAHLTIDELLDVVRVHLRPCGLTAGFGGLVGLVDATIHHQDIRRPLGLPRQIPADRLARVLTAVTTNPRLEVWRRIRGVRLVATDLDWSHGKWPEVRGTGESLLMAMIESNMLAVECHLHRKHVPPWCYISIRDPDQIGKELAPGEGAIAVLDALNTSYPGFLLTDDVGDVETGTCGCGRTGQVINFRGRGPGGGLGHCPVSIERYLGSGTTAHDEAAALVKA